MAASGPFAAAACGCGLGPERVRSRTSEGVDAPAVAGENEEARQKVVAFLNEHTEPDPERPGLLRITGPFRSKRKKSERRLSPETKRRKADGC